MSEQRNCKRLIEVDLPIKRISVHARQEKNVRQGHISSLHIWWARRPLAACRAIICSALWPDPADIDCPHLFRQKAKEAMLEWTKYEKQMKLSPESISRFEAARKNPHAFDDLINLRGALLDFIADFSDWSNSTVKEYLETSQALTQVAHEALGGAIGTRPVVVDPFAGGGAFPLEAARLGVNALAGDYNALAYTLNQFQLELIPRAKGTISDLCEEWQTKFLDLAFSTLSIYYPPEKNGAQVIAYLWARTIRCEGPGCGVEVPLLKTTTIGNRSGKTISVEIEYHNKQLKSFLVTKKPTISGTSKRGSVTCPNCGFTTPRKNVSKQSIKQGFGFFLYAIGFRTSNSKKTDYRDPLPSDLDPINKADVRLKELQRISLVDGLSLIPQEELPYLRSIFNVRVYGIDRWDKIFTNRQIVSAVELTLLFREFSRMLEGELTNKDQYRAVVASLALALSNSLQYQCNIATWLSESVKSAFIQGQSLPMKMDFVEANPLSKELAGGLEYSFSKHLSGVQYLESFLRPFSEAHLCSATNPFLPIGAANLIVTDPPYYDVVPYADCSDFFNVWLYRMLKGNKYFEYPSVLSLKEEEIVQLAERNEHYKLRTKDWFENKLAESLERWNEVTNKNGRMVIVFAHKQTSAWEALLNSVLRAGWVVTASWPLETENSARMRANDSAVLSSSIHIVCQPRNAQLNKIGDWRDILQELPTRIHEWMPRLADEGVVGADAIFSCLGPALEIYSKFSRVEKANGDKVELREYLEQVWGAVAKEALNMIFQGAHTEGFEEDARLTAMWLWTLSAGSDTGVEADEEIENDTDSEEGGISKTTGFSLEFDAARKIAQGLGAHLENLSSVIEVKGDQARLLPVAERVNSLFGKGSTAITSVRKKKKENQMTLFEEINKVEKQGWSLGDEKSAVGKTILDRLHQAMILFGAGRGDAMRRFLIDEGIGKDERFWRLAQALSALYPSHTDEKRWVDGVLARKKSLGF